MRTTRSKAQDGRPPLREEVLARALRSFRETLRRRGLRHSSVRDAIARVALGYDGHFEVNDLVNELRRAGVEGAHLATVYRTLPLLVEAGIIQQTLLSSGERHFYEPAFERPHHDHIICIACGKVVEFEFEAFEVLQRDIAKRYGFELTAHVHELLGRCSDCRRAKKAEQRS
jgi:Fur family transcriptional regulator, ferric uptake regulator